MSRQKKGNDQLANGMLYRLTSHEYEQIHSLAKNRKKKQSGKTQMRITQQH
jgi:hypothetical protein